MSAYQANVKVEPPTKWVGSNAGFDRSQLHHINNDSRESAPSPMLPHGGPCKKRWHADCVGCSCLRQRAFRREPECERRSLGAMRQRAEAGPGRSAWPWYIEMKRIKAKPTIIEMKIYLFG